jgi:hypothetical protein
MYQLPGELIGFGKRGPIFNIGGGSEPSTEPTVDDNGLPVGGVHPAWNELLGVLPQEAHAQAIPVLKKWSQGVDQGFQKVHQQYDPFKSFVEQGVDPEVLNYGLNLVNQVESNPTAVFNALAEALGYDVSDLVEGSNEPGDEGEGDYAELPPQVQAQLAELMERDETIAQFLMQQQDESQIAEEEQLLEEEISDLHARFKEEKGYDFDDLWVLSRYEGSDDDLETAVQDFYTTMDAVMGTNNRPKPPVLLGSGGSLPSGGKKPGSMSGEETREHVRGILQAMNQNR